jgi:predicted amino acid dehydrogenase
MKQVFFWRLLYRIPVNPAYPPVEIRKSGFAVHPMSEDYNEWAKSAAEFKPGLAGLIMCWPAFVYWVMLLLYPMRKLFYTQLKYSDPAGAISSLLWTVPMISKHLASKNPFLRHLALRKIIQATHLCRMAGAGVMGLGAYTAIAGKKGKGQDIVDLVEKLKIPIVVTTGNGVTAIAAVTAGLQIRDCQPGAPVAVIGPLGSVGGAIVRMLLEAGHRHLVLIGNPGNPNTTNLLKQFKRKLYKQYGVFTCAITTSPHAARQEQCRLVFCAMTGTLEIAARFTFVEGVIAVDCARPRRLKDLHLTNILVIDGGMVSTHRADTWTPRNPGFGNAIPGCMAETIALSCCENREHRHYSIGRITPDELRELSKILAERGFFVSGPRFKDKAMDYHTIELFTEKWP